MVYEFFLANVFRFHGRNLIKVGEKLQTISYLLSNSSTQQKPAARQKSLENTENWKQPARVEQITVSAQKLTDVTINFD